jgi:hypothetical protein
LGEILGSILSDILGDILGVILGDILSGILGDTLGEIFTISSGHLDVATQNDHMEVCRILTSSLTVIRS